MHSNQLKPWQAEKILVVVQRFAWYVEKLRQRMETRRFSHSDPLYRAVLEVQRALCSLQSELIAIVLRNGEPRQVNSQRTDDKPPDQVRRGL